MVRQLHGIGSSVGIAIASAAVVPAIGSRISRGSHTSPHDELSLFRAAKQSVEHDLHDVARRAHLSSPTLASIVETHAMIVSDPVVSQDIEQRILNGESAVDAVIAEFVKQARLLMLSTNSLFRDRAIDIQHVQERLIAELQPQAAQTGLHEPAIVVAASLTPADMFRFSEQGAVGFILEDGGIDSHVSIIARDLGIPAIVSVHDATSSIVSGEVLIVDANNGTCFIDPDDQLRVDYSAEREQEQIRIKRERTPVHGAVVTTDGTEIYVLANVDNPAAAVLAHQYHAHGIGLVRTEMMLSGDGTFPSIEQQTSWYSQILRSCPERTVTFRAFDIGGDKFGSYSPYTEQNPVLGLRGIRFLLAQPGIFEQQITALLRAADSGRTRIMLPMITSYAEVSTAREIIDHCIRTIEEERQQALDVPVGIMIETPAAAIMSDVLSKYVDFISIGTNDLTQYTLAADRTNELVSDMFDCIHPSVIRLMTIIVESAHRNGVEVSVCGEMAAQVAATDLLLGIGVQHFSVTPHVVPELQRRIQSAHIESSRQLVDQLVECRTSSDVRAMLLEYQSQERRSL